MVKRFRNLFLNTFALLILLITSAFIISDNSRQEVAYTLNDIQKVYPEAKSYKCQPDQSIEVRNGQGSLLGHLLCSTDLKVHYQGYAGIVPVLIAFNTANIITGVYLLKNNEEEEFINEVKDGKLLTRWNGKALISLTTTQNVDAVTGATYSSNAIINTVRHTIAAYLKTAIPTPISMKHNETSDIAAPAKPTTALKEKKSVGPRPYIMPKPALVIGSYSATGEPDIMTAAWTGIANSNPLCIAVSIQQKRKTYENIKATGYFTVNVPSAAYAAQMDYVGVISGRQENKFKSLGLTAVKGQYVNAPYVGEFPVVLECQVIDTLFLGSHTQFIGKVLDTKVDTDLLDKNNRVMSEKMQPVIFDDQGYFSYGRYLGKPFDLYKTLRNPTTTEVDETSASNPTLETIFKRKSVRTYTDKAVSKEQLRLLIKAGMAAPSAADKRPWVFVALTNRNTLNKLADALPHARMLKQATAAIMVGSDMNKTFSGEGKTYWVQDCSAATENILLAAESMGLGAVWTGVHPISEREKAVATILHTPDHIRPLCVIAIGYPTGIEQPQNKWDEQLLHWEKW